MTDSNALLVKPKLSRWSEVRDYMAHDYYALDLDYQIYVPRRFILGHFKDRKDGFKLSQSGIYYRHSSEDLQQYQKSIDEEKREIVRHLLLPESVLEKIAEYGHLYLSARGQIYEQVRLLEQDLV